MQASAKAKPKERRDLLHPTAGSYGEAEPFFSWSMLSWNGGTTRAAVRSTYTEGTAANENPCPIRTVESHPTLSSYSVLHA